MEQLFKTIADISIAASVLCVLILGARLVIGRRPTVMLTLLGALLIVRLAVPVMIPSPLSAMNLLSGISATQTEEQLPPVLPPAASYDLPDMQYNVPDIEWETEVNAGLPVNTQPEEISAADAKPVITAAKPLSGAVIAVIVWLSGTAAFALCIALCNIRFSRRLKKNRPYDAPGFDELLLECRNEMGIRNEIRTVQLSGISTAAVYGVYRPKLLISPSFGWLSQEEKRHVLLHELAHIKRRDTLLSLLITVLSIVYWFNPLVWAAFAMLRGDMELMCDAAVIERTGDRKGYAETLINLAQSRAPRPRLVTALFMRHSFNGLFISTDSIKRRIRMITRYKKNSALFTAIALILVIAIAIVGCTGPAAGEQTKSPEATAPAASQSPQVSDGSQEGIQTTELPVEFSGTYTLKDKTLSVSIPKGWAAIDNMNSGVLSSPDPDTNIWISSMEITGNPRTPESAIDSTYIAIAGNDGKPFSLKLDTLSSQPVTAGGIEGKIFELSAPLENGDEWRGLEAAFVGAYKYYTIGLLAKNKEEFDKYKSTFYDLLDTLEFEPNDWHAKFADKFTDGAVEQTENSYKSADVNVSINKVQENGAAYIVADIYVAEPKYFKTAFPGNPESMGDREPTDTIAKGKNAVIAINGDHCVDNPGPVVRNGINYRSETAGDVLVMNYDGSMKAYSADELDLAKIENEGAYQVWTFGPMLLKDGKPLTQFNSPQDINGKNPRTAVGYYEPGHYCFVVVDGRQPGYSDGMTMEQLSQLMADLGCKEAFNLDGGQTSEMAFMGKLVNQPYNGGRSTTDILYVGEE